MLGLVLKPNRAYHHKSEYKPPNTEGYIKNLSTTRHTIRIIQTTSLREIFFFQKLRSRRRFDV